MSDLAIQNPHPMLLIQQSIDKGASFEQVKALMDLAERWEVMQDKRAFRDAMVRFKENPPKIVKDAHVKFQTSKGVTEYDHATIGNVSEAIGTALAAVGISHGWTTSQADGRITVTCTLSLGTYSESTSLTASPDESGGKNLIQAIVSTKTYLERHTLTGITGMATFDPDDDGNGGPKDLDHEKVVAERVALISEAVSMDALKATFSDGYRQAERAGDKQAMEAFTAAKNARKKELDRAKKEYEAAYAQN